jgi:hypothetical protein
MEFGWTGRQHMSEFQVPDPNVEKHMAFHAYTVVRKAMSPDHCMLNTLISGPVCFTLEIEPEIYFETICTLETEPEIHDLKQSDCLLWLTLGVHQFLSLLHQLIVRSLFSFIFSQLRVLMS